MVGEVIFLEWIGVEVVDFEGLHACFMAFGGLFEITVGFPFPLPDGLGENGLVLTFAEFEVEVVVGLLP